MSTKVSQQVRQKKIAPYKDTKRRLRIEVNKMDVKHAKCFAPDECVIARAIARQIPNAYRAWVYENSVYVAFADPKTAKLTATKRYIPSPNVKAAINGFDNKKGFEPGTYWLEVPKGSQTLIAGKKRSRKRGTGKGMRHMPTGKGASCSPKKSIQVEKTQRLQSSFAY